jgi:hypothetical protein
MSTKRMAQPQLTTAWHEELGARLRAELGGLAHPALWIALGVLMGAFLLAVQLPLRYRINVGYDEGYGSDRPYIRNFDVAEDSVYGNFRWTRGDASILIPGVGQRSLLVWLDMMPTSALVRELGPQTVEVLVNGRSLARLPVELQQRRVMLLAPGAMLEQGQFELILRSTTFSPPGDRRVIGVPFGGVRIESLLGARAWPAWSAVLGWLGAVTLGWLTLRHALEGPDVRRGARRPAVIGLGLLTSLVALAALIDLPRWAFGAQAALVASGLAYLLAVLTRHLLPGVMRLCRLALDPPRLGWLSLFVALSFALRYGGRLYPGSMHGDIGFHFNRFFEAIQGHIYLISRNRGVPFPYPPGPYTLVAPFTLLGIELPTVLQLGAALVDALSAVVVYIIAVRALGQRVALLAAGIYVFTAATFMTTWWSFSSHIFTQFLHLLLIAGLLEALEVWQGDAARQRRWWILGVAVLLSLVFLGHFGFLINTTLLSGLLVVSVWLASWRGAAWAQRVRWPLSLACMAAGAFAAVFFYSAYLPLFLSQLTAASEDGLTAITNRDPVSRASLWNTLWRAGFITHFGLFPLLLMPVGVGLLAWQARSEARLGPQRALLWLMLGSLSISGIFALWPFVSGVSNNPRWLMFIAWVVAVGAAVAVEALWRRGWQARAGVLIMGALTIANTAWIWIGPMLWRIRPPEPF